MNRIILAFLLLSLSVVMMSCNGTTIYVDAGSESVADGSEQKPYKDVRSAFNAARGKKNVEVIFREGVYRFEDGFLVDETMSGLKLRAYDGEKVVFSGGVSVPLNLLEEDRAGAVSLVKVNLKEAGINDFGEIHSTGFGRPFLSSWGEVFINGKPMSLSRWPNEGMIPMGKVLDSGSVPRNGDMSNRGAVMAYDSPRVSEWEFDGDMWIGGYFNYGYADDALRLASIDTKKKTLTTVGPTMYGFESGKGHNLWYAFNIKEETDKPGEYHLDRKTGELRFVSPVKTIETVDFTILDEPFFDIWKADNVTIEGITFEYSRAVMLSLVETDRVRIKDCTFRNGGSLAIQVGYGITPFENLSHESVGMPIRGGVGSLQQHIYKDITFDRKGGVDNTIDGCVFYNLGAGAISLGGGDRVTLTPAGNVVSNCLFHDNNRIERSYRPDVHITGVGNKITNCEMYNAPSMVILLHGNDHIIENNYIHDVCLEVDDQGAFYYGRDPSECGNIVRNNLFANMPDEFRTSSVYLDDGAGGMVVEGNIFYKGGYYPLLLGGGSDNEIKDNIFIDSKIAMHIDNRMQSWAKNQVEPGGIFEVRLKAVNYLEEPYAVAYPYLKNYLPHDGAPKNNIIVDNHFIGIERNYNIYDESKIPEGNLDEDYEINVEPYSKEALFEIISEKGLKDKSEMSLIGIRK